MQVVQSCFLNSFCELSGLMVYVLLAGLLAYIILLIVLLIGLNNMVAEDVVSPGKIHRLSVIVPFRNEIQNLPGLMDCLQRQNFPVFDVIFVDDHSTDLGPDCVAERCREEKRFKLIRATGQGKKHALTEGIRVSKGEIIVTTDADCVCSSDWLTEMNKPFADEKVKLVFGPVHSERGRTLFHSLQQIEFASVMAAGMAMFGLGHSLYCNAANLAYRKEAFNRVGGFEGNDHVASGDDQFLLDKIKSAYKDPVYLLNTPEVLVITKPQETIRNFVHQRLRWAGKWSRTMTFTGRALAMGIFAIQFVFIFAYWQIASENSIILIVMMSTKLLLEFIMVGNVLSIAGQRISLLHFVILQLIYPFYVIGIGVLSNFASFEWKGRQHAALFRNAAVKR